MNRVTKRGRENYGHRHVHQLFCKDQKYFQGDDVAARYDQIFTPMSLQLAALE